MPLRVRIFEPYEAIRESLAMFVQSLGHEVVAEAAPERCSCCKNPGQPCAETPPCGDAFLVGQHLGALRGVEFVNRKILAGCRNGVSNLALFCRPWSEGERLMATALGCRYFEMPVDLHMVAAWLKEVENAEIHKEATACQSPVA